MLRRVMRAALAALVMCLGCADLRLAHAVDRLAPPDGVPWRFPAPAGRLIAVGDLHGDAQAFIEILRQNALIDPQLRWIGGNAQLVLVGDLFDRGNETRLLVDLVLLMREQARAAGGELHVLLGNHELMRLSGDTFYSLPRELLAYENFWSDLGIPLPNGSWESYDPQRLALSDRSYVGRFLAGLNTMLMIGDSLFVHAGVGSWLNAAEVPARVNATVREWVRHWSSLGAVPAPPQDTAWVWVIAPGSPLWDRTIADGEASPEVVSGALAAVGAQRMVLGHSVVDRIERAYGGSVYLIDTGISREMEGELSSLEIFPDGRAVESHFSRPPRGQEFLSAQAREHLCERILLWQNIGLR